MVGNSRRYIGSRQSGIDMSQYRDEVLSIVGSESTAER